jgi:hypothetical protein
VFVYVCSFLCVCVQVEALRPVQGVLPTVPDQETEELSPMLQKREQAPKWQYWGLYEPRGPAKGPKGVKSHPTK